MDQILDSLVQAGVLVVIAIIGYISTWVVKFINAKKDQIAKETSNESVKMYVDLVSRNAIQVVETLNGTLVNELREKSSDGKLTEAEIRLIRDNAMSMLKDTLSEEARTTLSYVVGDLDKYLSSLIEATVVKVKKENAMPIKISGKKN
jgi:hypothetical protein